MLKARITESRVAMRFEQHEVGEFAKTILKRRKDVFSKHDSVAVIVLVLEV